MCSDLDKLLKLALPDRELTRLGCVLYTTCAIKQHRCSFLQAVLRPRRETIRAWCSTSNKANPCVMNGPGEATVGFGHICLRQMLPYKPHIQRVKGHPRISAAGLQAVYAVH